MAAYLIPIIALLVGIYGVFYSDKDGRKKLNIVSVGIVVGLLFTAAAAIYKAYQDSQTEATKDKQNSNYQAGLRDSIQNISKDLAVSQAKNLELNDRFKILSESLDREKKNSDVLRGIVLAKTFSGKDIKTNGIVFVDLPLFDDEALSKIYEKNKMLLSKNITGSDPLLALYPLVGPGIKETRFTFTAPGILEVNYKILNENEIIAFNGQIDAETSEKCPLYKGGLSPGSNLDKSEKPYNYFPPKGTSCFKPTDEPLDMYLELNAPVKAMVINLPANNLFYKSYSRIDQAQRSGELGGFEIDFKSKADRDLFYENQHKPVLSVKFFRPYSTGNNSTNCSTAFQVTFELGFEKYEDDGIHMPIKGVSNQSLNICEISPF